MVNFAWPLDAVSGSPLNTGRRLRQTQMAPLLAGATAARPLGARSGVRPGTSPSTVTASSTTWAVAAHAGVLDVQAAAEAGPYGYAVDASVTGSVTAANASNPRVDIVYVQLNDPAEGDGTSVPGITVGYLAGTAAASPVAPTKPARSLVLAQINVPKSGSGSPTVSWVASYSAAAGGVVDYPNKATLLADAAPTNTLGRDIETGSFYHRQPATTPFWLHVGGRPDTGAYSPTSVYTADGTRGFRAYAQGGRVYTEGAIRSTTATFVANTTYVAGSIPVAYAPKTIKAFSTDINRVLGYVTFDVDGTIRFTSTVGFTGVLDMSMDGFNWLDSRLA